MLKAYAMHERKSPGRIRPAAHGSANICRIAARKRPVELHGGLGAIWTGESSEFQKLARTTLGGLRRPAKRAHMPAAAVGPCASLTLALCAPSPIEYTPSTQDEMTPIVGTLHRCCARSLQRNVRRYFALGGAQDAAARMLCWHSQDIWRAVSSTAPWSVSE